MRIPFTRNAPKLWPGASVEPEFDRAVRQSFVAVEIGKFAGKLGSHRPVCVVDFIIFDD